MNLPDLCLPGDTRNATPEDDTRNILQEITEYRRIKRSARRIGISYRDTVALINLFDKVLELQEVHQIKPFEIADWLQDVHEIKIAAQQVKKAIKVLSEPEIPV